MTPDKACYTNHTANIRKAFMNKMLKEIMSVVNADSGSLFLFDGKNQELILDTFYNSTNLKINGHKQRIGEGVSGKIMGEKVPILVKDIKNDLRFQRNGFKHYKTDSFISIPLFTSEGILGLINIADKTSGEAFCERDLHAAVVITRYGCAAIDNFSHYLALKYEKEDLKLQKIQLEKFAPVGKLTAGIVHEISNPLDGVVRYTNLLIEQAEKNSLAREYLMAVKSGLNRIVNITKSLLEFSRQVNSGVNSPNRHVDLQALIDDILTMFEDRLVNIRVVRECRDNLPQVMDLGLCHVVTNIIKNAIDAMPEGGVFCVKTEIDQSGLIITFNDNGSGMPLKIKERIFEPFFTTKELGKGTGLGLAICKEIISRYDGKICVDSIEDKGSTVTVLIPNKHLKA